MELYAQVLSYAIPFFIVLILIEAIVGYFMGKKVIRSFDTISSISSGLTNVIKDILGLVVIIVSYGFMVDHFALFHFENTILLYILAFIGIDFAGYWGHRFEHVFNILWNRHIIHHSSEEFNLACALRQNVSVFFAIFFFLYLPLAILGVPQEVIAITAPIHLFAQFWYHTTLIGRLGWLEHIIVTPSHHRVHHAINDIYLDKNFSQVFIVWDKWFGTFQEELAEEPPVYGVKRQSNTWNPLKINFQHLGVLIMDAWRTRSWKDKFLIWMKPTGWRPNDVEEAYPIDYIKDARDQEKYETEAGLYLKVWSWLQLTLHIGLLLHFFSVLLEYQMPYLLLYASFLWVSIYAYTSLMDGTWDALGAEILKVGLVFLTFILLGSWFSSPGGIQLSGFIIAYSLLSLGISIYTLTVKRPVQVKLLAKT